MPNDNIRIDAGGWSPDADIENADWLKPRWLYANDVDSFLRAKDISQGLTAAQREALGAMLADRRRARTPDDLELELAEILG